MRDIISLKNFKSAEQDLRHGMRCDFLSFVVQILCQSVVIVLVEDEEGHANRATVRINAIFQQVSVVGEVCLRDGTVECQKDQLSCVGE